MEICFFTPRKSTRASTQAETQRWHDTSHRERAHSGASPREPSKVYFAPSMVIAMCCPSSRAQETTYLKNSRESGSRRAFAVSEFAVSEFAVSEFAVSEFAVSEFAVS